MDRHEIPQYIRRILIQELELWSKEGRITLRQLDDLRGLYDFDLHPQPSSEIKPAAQPVSPLPPADTPATAKPVPTSPPSTAAVVIKTPPSVPPQPPRPHPTLAQTLLSETSIKIALYLGAFFVIAAALILAALVADLRLPILGTITIIFAGGALVLKKRLPQPSFILYLVFSALLIITAGVLADLRNLTGMDATRYWSFALLTMSLVWAFSTYLYKSRLFSLTAFLALDAALIVGIGLFLKPVIIWYIFLLGLSSLVGLGAAFTLHRWQGKRMSSPVFMLAEVQNALVILGLVIITISGFGYGECLLAAATYISASTFFILGNLLYPLKIYPWLAAALLMPVGWLMARFFSHERSFFNLQQGLVISERHLVATAIAFTVWGGLYTLAGNLFARARKQYRMYTLPASIGAIPLLIAGSLIGRTQDIWLCFGLSLGAAITLVLTHIFYRRAWLWIIALGFSLAAYLSLLNGLTSPPAYHWCSWFAGATFLLLLPEMILTPGKLSEPWRWPLRNWAIVTGILTLLTGFGLQLFGSGDQPKIALFTLRIVALVYLAYGIRLQKSWPGILFTLHLTLSVVFGLVAYNIASWLPILTCLAVLFFGCGVFLDWVKSQSWSVVFRWSGLVLGGILSLAAFGYTGQYRAFYVAAITAVFLLETLRHTAELETIPGIIASFAFGMALHDANVRALGWYSMGIAAIFFSLEWAYIFMKRKGVRWVTRGFFGLAAVLTPILAVIPIFKPDVGMITVGVVALLYLAFGIRLQRSWFGILFSLHLTLSLMFMISNYQINYWLPILTCLAVFYYGCGVLLKWLKIQNWSLVFRWSGLILGLLLSLAAFADYDGYRALYVTIIAALFLVETFRDSAWLEVAPGVILSLAFAMALDDIGVRSLAYYSAGIAAIFLILDLAFLRLKRFGDRWITRGLGGLAALLTPILVVTPKLYTPAGTIVSIGLAAIFLVQAFMYRQAVLGYAVTIFFTLSVLFTDLYFVNDRWVWILIITAILFYSSSILLDHLKQVARVLRYSGIALASLTALSAPFEKSGLMACIPVALAATLWAVEALRRRNVWLSFPANGLYLMAYFMILSTLKVDQAQFYSMGAALLGMLMHYLLVRAGSKAGAFVMGMISQLVLIGTSYIQFVDTENIWYFAVMFFQSLAVLAYGIVIRSRSLVITPIVLVVVGVATIVFGTLRSFSTVILVGITGISLIGLGIAAMLLRERISSLRDLLKDWHA